MKYMLDTNICIYIIKNKPDKVIQKFRNISVNDVCISSVTFSELRVGVEKSLYPDKNELALGKFLSNIEILDYGVKASIVYGKIRAILENKGNTIGAYDMMIAAHALSKNLTIITNNVKEFGRINGLKVENWAE